MIARYNRYLETLFDMAQETAGFEGFWQEVVALMRQTLTAKMSAYGRTPLKALRAGTVSPPTEFTALGRKSQRPIPHRSPSNA